MRLRVSVDGQSFEVEVGDLAARPILVTVEGDTFEVWPEEDYRAEPAPPAAAPLMPAAPAPAPVPAVSMLAVQMPGAKPRANGGGQSGAVTAPIPGVILSLSVKEGEEVAFGQELCVLEAMKMKNQIRASRAGKIRAVCIAAGEQVKHGQVLFEFAD